MEPTQQSTHLYEAEASDADLRAAIQSGELPVAVYGLGKMGLPLATVLASATGNVTGVDIDPQVVETIAAGECPVQGEPGLESKLQRTRADGSLRVTTDDVAAATDARVHVVIVPTLLDGANEPDLTALDGAIDAISRGVAPGDLVVIESTVPPGTCRDVIQPMLADESGLPRDAFGLAFCPERTASGRAIKDIQGAYPKVVGGRDPASTHAASLLYEQVTSNQIVTVADCTTAECVKLFEGVYRDVNIALANELATLAEELRVDVTEAIDAANMPGYCDIHDPGPGVGGHCIPYYPYFIANTCETRTPLLETARSVNESMPAQTVRVLEARLADRGIDVAKGRIAILGVTYRAGVDETRAAPAFTIAEELSALGATVYAVDPICSDMEGMTAERVSLDTLPRLDLDAAVLVTAHEEFQTLGWDEMDDIVLIDGRGALEDERLPQTVFRLGDGSHVEESRPTEVATHE